MSRPSPQIILQREIGLQTWQILAHDQVYVILYRGRPVNIRVEQTTLTGPVKKYKKLTYTNQGNALAQARMLNHRFACEDFTVVEIGCE